MPDHSGCSKNPQPSVDWETRSLDGLHIVCFWVDYLCIYVSMYSIQTYHTDEISEKWDFEIMTSSEPLRLMDRNTSQTTWWWNPVDRPDWLLYAFHRNAVKWLFCKETSPLWNTDSFMLEIHEMDNLATIPIISIHVLLAWHSRPWLACHGSWRDASEGLQSAAWWLDSQYIGQWPNPSRALSDGISPLRPVAVFFVEFWHFGLRRLWMSPDAILPHLTSDQRRWDVKMLRISSLMYSFTWHHHNTWRILTHIRWWIPTGSDSFAKLNLAWWSCSGFKRDLMHW